MCNFSDIEDHEIVILAALRGSAGFLCAVINAVLLAAISIGSDKSCPIQRVLVYVTFSSLLALLASTFQAESAGCSTSWHRPLCETVGFLTQFTSWILLLVSLWLSLVVALRHWCPNDRVILTARRDAVVWGVVTSLSFLLSAVPLVTRGYGMNRAWCWIQRTHLVEQWVLWYGWLAVVVVTNLLVLVTALSCSERRLGMYYESSRGINNTRRLVTQEAGKRIKILTACIAIYLLAIAVSVALNHVRQINEKFGFLVASAIFEPLGVVAVPVIFATSLHDIKPCVLAVTKATEHKKPHPLPPSPSLGESESSINSGCVVTQDPKKKGPSSKKLYRDFSEEITSSLLLTTSQSSANSDLS